MSGRLRLGPESCNEMETGSVRSGKSGKGVFRGLCSGGRGEEVRGMDRVRSGKSDKGVWEREGGGVEV